MKAIHSVLTELPHGQAAVIAQTEGNTAYNIGRIATAREARMQEKCWSADGTGACAECRAQISVGWMPIDGRFPGGVVAPCLHDGCDCGLNFRRG
jgi:hypothetical protein